MANTTFTHIANATEFTNIANYVKNNGTTTECYVEYTSYTHNAIEYTVWCDGIEEIAIDDTVTTLYPDGSLKYWKW